MRPSLWSRRSSYVSASILWAACWETTTTTTKLSDADTDAGRCILPPEDAAVWHPGLTLLWYPEGFCVSRHHLMHDSTELIQHLQALLLPHAGVVESWESWLKGGAAVRPEHRAERWRRASVWRLSYLCGLGEDEFRVFYQTLQRHRHINHLCPLVPSAVVRHKFAVPGVEDDEAWFKTAALNNRVKQPKPNIILCYFNAFQDATCLFGFFLIGLKQLQHAEFIYSYINIKKDCTFILIAT